MSTSDKTPTAQTPGDNTPAEDRRLDRLYQAVSEEPAQAESPADLDNMIRAAAKAPQPESSYWHWQQRYGWATAAAIVLTSALFLALPDTPSGTAAQRLPVPGPALPTANSQNAERPAARSQPAPVPRTDATQQPQSEEPGPAATPELDPNSASDTSVDTLLIPRDVLPEPPPPAAPSIATSADSRPEVSQLAPAFRGTAEAPAAMSGTTAADEARPRKSQAAKALRQEPLSNDVAIEEIVVTGSYGTSGCTNVDAGLIEQICDVPGRSRSYLLHPNESSKCKELRLDRQRSRPSPESDSNADRFVYKVGSRKYSATCERGRWVVQPFARGR